MVIGFVYSNAVIVTSPPTSGSRPAAVVAVGFSVTCMSASSVAFTPSDGCT